MKFRIGTVLLAVAVSGLTQPVHAQLGKGRAAAKANVNLLASVEAIEPGQAFDVGLQFELAEGWHIYWKNSGDSGLPPKVAWKLPEGFSAGDLQFPIPTRHVSAGSIVTNILEGGPVLPVKITPPAAIAAKTVTLAAKVTYLICNRSCLRESADVTVELPVLASGADALPANAPLFRLANRSLPTKTSKYLVVSGHTQPATLSPGDKFELLVEINITRGFHIQSNTPSNKAFIACEIFMEPAADVYFGEAVYPPGKTRTIKYVGEVSEYNGRITIRQPGEIDADASAVPQQFSGIVKYQACDEKGTCFPPTALAFTVMMGGEANGGATAPTPMAGIIESPTSEDVGHPAESADSDAALAGDSEGLGEKIESFLRGLGLPGLLLGCFLYGLFINATPCVLPLLSIKVLGFVQQSHESRGRTMILGLAFGAGVLIFFVVLGFLAAGGTNILQHTPAVIALSAVVLALALSMLGVFTLQVPTAATSLEAKIQQEGVVASFGKGALAPVLGFACTGPLLAGAFGWATQQPKEIALLAFLVAGLGMASPYVLLGANPKWLSFLPKPGQWMITFERIMGFLLLLMVLWLLYPVGNRVGAEGLQWTLAFFVFIGMGCWLLGKIDITMEAAVRFKYRVGAGALVVVPGLLIYGWLSPLDAAASRVKAAASGSHGKIAWRVWSEAAVSEAVLAGHTVFVDVTADYCTNCKVNKARATYRPETIAKIEELDVVAFQADFSNPDPAIFAFLKKHNRAGPPLNLIFPPGKPDNPIILPTLFGLEDLVGALDRAGPSLSKVSIN